MKSLSLANARFGIFVDGTSELESKPQYPLACNFWASDWNKLNGYVLGVWAIFDHLPLVAS